MTDSLATLLADYVALHSEQEPVHLQRLYRLANLKLAYGRMVSGHLQGRLLKMLVAISGARRVLELGTFAGYSALCLAEGLPEEGEVHTIEIFDELEDFIRSEALTLPNGEKVTLHIGDALDIMDSFTLPFDFIFIDADKRLYSLYYEKAMSLLRPGGLIVADNTLWDGHVVEEKYNADPQTKGVRDFNTLVASDPRVSAVILPLRDGLTLIRKH
ncbi:MAG: methyltransferase [Bacteroidales bacterium]|nr:methyltransferase [Bacteroidales bacterium]